MARVPLLLSAFAIAGLAACNPADRLLLTLVSNQNQTITAQVGFEVDITVQAVDALYQSPPTISTPAVSFLGDSVIAPNDPGGPVQKFRFRAESGGMAVIDFVSSGGATQTVEDTIVVVGPN